MGNREFDFRGMQDKLQKVLGEDFMTEMNKFIPKKGPSIDMFETEENVYVVAELPGISPNDQNINLRLEGYKLFIEGVIPFSYPVKELIQSERFFGKFKREIVLPYSIMNEGVHATYKKGLLVITIPKREEGEKDQIYIDFDDS